MNMAFSVIWWVSFALAVVAFAAGQVSRARLERFADRQALTITAHNGEQVIRYLATTRRWRTAGFVGGLVVSQATQTQRLGEISPGTEWIIVVVGWLLGALIAEARVEHLRHGSVRSASLERRRPGRYLRPFAWALVPASGVVALATGAATAAAEVAGWAEPDWTWAGVWLAAALAVATTVRGVQHAVLRRPQPQAAADVIEADDAIRSRALHVLSGGGAALALLMVLNQIGSIHPIGVADSVIFGIRIVGALGVGLFGWFAATAIWAPPTRAEQPGRPAVGAA
jgi:hypothetical protein